MNLLQKSLPIFALAFAYGSAPSYAAAIPITTGGTVTTFPGAAAPPYPVAVGAPVYDTGYEVLNAPTFNAGFEETVFHDANNVLCAGCLTFAVQFENLAPIITQQAPNGNAIEHFTFGSFTGFLTDVGYNAGSGGSNGGSATNSAPVTVDESLGGVISFNFTSSLFPASTGILPNDASDVFYVETNAMNVTAGNGALIDSSSANVRIDVPAAAVATTPEPSSLLLLGTGMLGAFAVARRKFGLA